MNNFSDELTEIFEKMESQYCTYPFIHLYEYIFKKKKQHE